jgi:hypothetical protein
MTAETRVFDGLTRGLVKAFKPLNRNFNRGVFVAAGDINGDGVRDIIVAPDKGGVSIVTVFSGSSIYAGGPAAQLTSFRAFPGRIRTGVRLAAKPVDTSGSATVEKVNLLLAAGPGAKNTSRRVLQATFNGLTPAVVDRVFAAGYDGVFLG